MEEAAVVHPPDARRYELHRGDELVGVLDYVERHGKLLLTHSEVDHQERNKGLGGRLVHDALADLHGRGRRTTPTPTGSG